MADMQTLYRALQNAHAAGDVQAATQLATYIKSMQEQPQAAPEEPGFFGGAKAAAVRGLESVPESASGIGLGILCLARAIFLSYHSVIVIPFFLHSSMIVR